VCIAEQQDVSADAGATLLQATQSVALYWLLLSNLLTLYIVLLCAFLVGQAAPQPVSLLAAARADAGAEEAGVPVSRKAMQTAQAAVTVAPKQQEQGMPSRYWVPLA
jgi:hypothetical protein